MKLRNNNGFTLMELLIVVAIIGVLIAVGIPVFTAQLENSKIAVDQSNVRAGKAAVLTEWMLAGENEDAEYVFDASRGIAVDKSAASGVSGYGQYTKDDKEDVIGAKNAPNKDGVAQYLVFYVHADGTTEASWGESASYVTITGGTAGVDDNFSYDSNAYIGEAKRALLKTDNAARIQHDQKLLDALSEYFTNLDLNSDEAGKIFGSGRLEKLKNGGQECLFEYQVNQNGVIRLSNFDTGYQPYFSTALNYKPTYISTTFSKNLDEKNIRTDTNLVTGSNGYNYVNQYLFTSNAFVGGEGSAGKVQVRIQYKNGKAVITTK